MNAEFSSGVGGGGDDAALIAFSADDDCFAFERRIEELFDRDEERVHIDMEDHLHIVGRGFGPAAELLLGACGPKYSRNSELD
jgi:hypothetical protein